MSWLLKGFIAVVVVGIIAAAVLVTGIFGDDSQTQVAAEEVGPLPTPAKLNRADDYGAETVRAYLQGALSCTADGERLMTQLGRPGERQLRELMQHACERKQSGQSSRSGSAEVAREDLDSHGRALWRISSDDASLPDDLLVWVRMDDSGWEIDRPCDDECED